MNLARFARRHSRGLTLIELVVVLAILVGLAALVVPQFDFLKRTSDKTNGAFNMASATQNIQSYRTLTGSYPDNWDSLVASDDNTTQSAFVGADQFTNLAIAEDEVDSLQKIGISNVVDHNPDATSGDYYRNLPGNLERAPRAIVDGGDTLMVVTDPDMIANFYPNKAVDLATGLVTLDASGATARLVVLGLGIQNEAVGQTLISAPEYTGVNPRETYNKMLAVFAVYDGFNTDKRAQLKGFLDSKGDFLTQELAEIAENDLQ